MKKQELKELVRRNLQSGDAPISVRKKYDPREISLYCEMAYNDLVYMIYEEGIKKGGDFSALDPFGQAFKRTVLFDTDRKEFYFDLGIEVVPLPDSQGIRQISPWNDQRNSFDYRDNNAQSTFGLLYVDAVSSRPWFYFENPIVYLGKIPQNLTTVMAKVIPPFRNLDENDEVFIPGKNSILFDMVYNAIIRKNNFPESQYDNGSSKQV